MGEGEIGDKMKRSFPQVILQIKSETLHREQAAVYFIFTSRPFSYLNLILLIRLGQQRASASA